jgi:hypothetical protein
MQLTNMRIFQFVIYKGTMCLFFKCVGHDAHLVQLTVPQVVTAKCSEPQAVNGDVMSEGSG